MSRIYIYIHIVWTTHQRLPIPTPKIEASIYKLILKEVKTAGYETLALNGMPDHIHLLLRCEAQIDLAKLMQRIKGRSSAMVNTILARQQTFRWREGYFAVSVTPSHLPKIRAYVANQQVHHRDNTISSAWEETDDDIASPDI